MDETRAGEILPWSQKNFDNLETCLRGTFHGVSRKHLQRKPRSPAGSHVASVHTIESLSLVIPQDEHEP